MKTSATSGQIGARAREALAATEAKRERARRETIARFAAEAPPLAPVREMARREGIRLPREKGPKRAASRAARGDTATSSPRPPVPEGSVGWQLQVETPNPLNGSQGRTAGAQRGRDARRAKQRKLSRTAALDAFDLAGVPVGGLLPCTIWLGRVGWTKGMDRDGLEAALKAIRDGIGDALGLDDDNDPRVEWAPYTQRRGAKGEKAIDVIWRPRKS